MIKLLKKTQKKKAYDVGDLLIVTYKLEDLQFVVGRPG